MSATPVEPRDRILARAGTLDETNDSIDVEVSSLVHRLLLFEQVVVKSVRLKELPALIHALGEDGLRLLIEAGALRIVCEGITVGSIGPLGLPSLSGVPLPPGSYAFSTIVQSDRDEYLESCFKEVNLVGASRRPSEDFKSLIFDSILPPINAEGVEDALATDATRNRQLMVRAVQWAVTEALGSSPLAFDYEIHVSREDVPAPERGRPLNDYFLRVETNLQALLSIDRAKEHELVERALLGIGGLNLRIAGMRTHTAIEAFQERDLSLVEDKLRFLLTEVTPNAQEGRLDRVLELSGLPSVDVTEPRSIDVERLLELRSSPECREFRAWLRASDGLDDDAIRDLLPTLRDRLGLAIRSRGARPARFAMSTGAGIATGDVSGTGVGIFDSFLLEKLLPHPGPLAWLATRYPSVYSGN